MMSDAAVCLISARESTAATQAVQASDHDDLCCQDSSELLVAGGEHGDANGLCGAAARCRFDQNDPNDLNEHDVASACDACFPSTSSSSCSFCLSCSSLLILPGASAAAHEPHCCSATLLATGPLLPGTARAPTLDPVSGPTLDSSSGPVLLGPVLLGPVRLGPARDV